MGAHCFFNVSLYLTLFLPSASRLSYIYGSDLWIQVLGIGQILLQSLFLLGFRSFGELVCAAWLIIQETCSLRILEIDFLQSRPPTIATKTLNMHNSTLPTATIIQPSVVQRTRGEGGPRAEGSFEGNRLAQNLPLLSLTCFQEQGWESLFVSCFLPPVVLLVGTMAWFSSQR